MVVLLQLEHTMQTIIIQVVLIAMYIQVVQRYIDILLNMKHLQKLQLLAKIFTVQVLVAQNYGSSTWSAEINSTIYGSDVGSSTTVGQYYIGYYYTDCTSATVTSSGATVYRFFRKAKRFKATRYGSKFKNSIYNFRFNLNNYI